MRLKTAICWLVASCTAMGACAQGNSGTIPPATSQLDLSRYPWVQPEVNYIQFYNLEALAGLRRAWEQSAEERMVVVLLGDSHLQTGPYPEQLSQRLRQALGDGGYGLLFPNSTVKMYAPTLYQTQHTGTWTGQRSVTMRPSMTMGLRGFTARTERLPASFSLNFGANLPKDYRRLRVFAKTGAESFDLELELGTEKLRIPLSETAQGYVDVELPPLNNIRQLNFKVSGTNPKQKALELYGLSLESAQKAGVVVHNAGVGAARYNSVLYQSRFVEELALCEPDLIVVDFGTNDYLYDDQVKPELEREVRQVVAKIREAAPRASIVLCSPQDLYWKGKNCTASPPQFWALLQRVAKDLDCGLYDWFAVAGGQATLNYWKEAGLCRTDMVHLTIPGYKLKGDLLFEALSQTVAQCRQRPQLGSLILERPEPKVAPGPRVLSGTTSKSSAKPTAPPAKGSDRPVLTEQWTVHVVAQGESLSLIAAKYKVSAKAIAQWNNLDNPDKIKVGQKLKIQRK